MIIQQNSEVPYKTNDMAQMLCSDVRQKLLALAEPEYRAFHSNLLPGIEHILGVRVPKLRDLAKQIVKAVSSDPDQSIWRMYLDTVQCEYYEEAMIFGMIIGYAKMDDEERIQRLDSFVPLINNWAVCDCCCSTLKFMAKNPEGWFPYLLGQIQKGDEFSIRFGVVCLMDYYITEAWIDRLLQIFQSVCHEAYYVKMAVAWAVSMCYVKFPEKTREFLETDTLDTFTHNKSIQKIRESYRVSKAEKEELNKLKRK